MSSKRRLRRRSCEGKRKHDSFENAQNHLYALIRKEYGARVRLVIYKCPFCKGYHIGHESERARQARLASLRN